MLLEIGLKSSVGEFSTIIRTKNFFSWKRIESEPWHEMLEKL